MTTKATGTAGIAFGMRDAGTIVEGAIRYCVRKARLAGEEEVVRVPCLRQPVLWCGQGGGRVSGVS